MPELNQSARLIRISTPLATDELVVTAIDGEESLSGLFQYDLKLMSDNYDIEQSQLLGHEVTVSLYTSGEDSPRFIHGYVNAFRLLDINADSLRVYELSIVPGMWFTSLGAKNRIFNNKSAKDIISEILRDYSSVVDFRFSLNGKPLAREYCVQYDESDYDFIHRLLAEEGISYYFSHSDGKHELVLIDDPQGFFDIPGDALEYDGGGSLPVDNSVHSWQRNYNYHTGGVELTDYCEFATTNNFRNSSSTQSALSFVSGYKREVHGLYRPKVDSDNKHLFDNNDVSARVEAIMQGEESRFDMAVGTSDNGALATGGRFTINHPISSEAGAYVVSRLTISAREGNQQETFFENEFECVPSTVNIRPLWNKPPKRIDYPQVAVVEEVKATASNNSADPYTQLKVKFPWNGTDTSCWVRVAQAFAGRNWGANFVPRVGQEVIVNYLNGDPARPIVTGAVYNGTNEGPNYTATQSGWKTQFDSSAFNEMRFDDKAGEEEVYMEAGKDHNWLVHNDQTGTVENDQTLTVTNNRTVTVTEGNEDLTVSKGDRSVAVSEGNYETSVAKGDMSVDVGKGDLGVNVGQGDYESTVGKGDLKTTVSMGDHLTTVSKGDDKLKVSMGNRQVDVSMGDHKVKCNLGKYSVNAMGGVKIESLGGIELKCGGSSIKMTPAGITIKGVMVTVKGDAMAEVKAGAMLTLKGGITMIN